MTMQDILTLAKAGYTAAQISALAAIINPPDVLELLGKK